ncbi:MAG: endospore germination permease [Desulfotomaculaceae bacterium]|nr:endospore germination permease [Desulfotomaculaceae bacterium]
MLEKGKIPSIALFLLLVNLVSATAIVSLPAATARFAGRDAWLVPIISTISGIIVILLVTALGRRFPGKSLIEYTQDILGGWLGKTVGVFYLFFFIQTSGVIIREFGELLGTLVMPRTPIVVFCTVIVLLAAYSVRSGLEVIGRLAELILPLATIFYIAVFLTTWQKVDFSRLLPVLENGFAPVLLGSVIPLGWRGEVLLLAMLLPCLAEPRKGRMIGIWSVVLLGLLLLFNEIIIIALFGPTLNRLIFPTFIIPSEILVGGFLRVDSIMVIVWMSGILLKLAIFYYATVLGTAQLLNLKDYKPVVLPIGVILTAFSILSFENYVEIPAHVIKGFPGWAYLFEWVIPLALLLIAVIRGFKPKY